MNGTTAKLLAESVRACYDRHEASVVVVALRRIARCADGAADLLCDDDGARIRADQALLDAFAAHCRLVAAELAASAIRERPNDATGRL